MNAELELSVVEALDGRVGNDVSEGSSKLVAVIISATWTNARLVNFSTFPEHVVKAKKSMKAEIAEDRNSEIARRDVVAKVYGVGRIVASPDVVTHRPLILCSLVIEYAVNTIEVKDCILEHSGSVTVVVFFEDYQSLASLTLLSS